MREVRIDRLAEGTYYAAIVVQGPKGTTEVDARPSDALALALVVGAPVRADRAVVETTEADETVAEALATIDSPADGGSGSSSVLSCTTRSSRGRRLVGGS